MPNYTTYMTFTKNENNTMDVSSYTEFKPSTDETEKEWSGWSDSFGSYVKYKSFVSGKEFSVWFTENDIWTDAPKSIQIDNTIIIEQYGQFYSKTD